MHSRPRDKLNCPINHSVEQQEEKRVKGIVEQHREKGSEKFKIKPNPHSARTLPYLAKGATVITYPLSST